MFLIEEVLITEDVYTKHFICNLSKCKGACCWEGDYGAPLEGKEIALLEEELEKIIPFLDDDAIETIKADGFWKYYDGIKKAGTQLMEDGRCAFMTKQEGIAKCGMEKAYEAGATPFKKPLSCHLYPIRIESKRENGFEVMKYDQWNICSAACALGEEKKVRIFEFVKEGIIRKYGDEFYHQLAEMVKKFDPEI